MAAGLWIVPVGVFGALVGSFLNVVIFRLPRGLSICSPAWSFCPHCQHQINPWHNIPILGWLVLRGKCHHCSRPISIVYPVIECLTSLVFVATWDACFIGRTSAFAVITQAHWTAAAAMIAMFAGLIATAGMDIESYTLDIRVPLFTTVVAIGLHSIHGTGAAFEAAGPVTPAALALVAIAGGIGWLVAWPLTGRWLNRNQEAQAAAEEPADSTQQSESTQSGESGTRPGSGDVVAGAEDADSTIAGQQQIVASQNSPAWPILLLSASQVGFIAWIGLAPNWPGALQADPGHVRGLIALAIFMVVLILASLVSREADAEIVTTLEQERASARTTAIRELLSLAPAIAAGIALFAYLRGHGWLSLDWSGFLVLAGYDTSAGVGGWSCAMGGMQSLANGLIAAALGWAVRIIGTLAFGKEAFGTGDIYLMAAIAAAGGWWLMLIAFFASAILALVGVVATSLHKSTRAIPFGPWLGLGAFAAMYLEPRLAAWFSPAGGMLWFWICGTRSAAAW